MLGHDIEAVKRCCDHERSDPARHGRPAPEQDGQDSDQSIKRKMHTRLENEGAEPGVAEIRLRPATCRDAQKNTPPPPHIVEAEHEPNIAVEREGRRSDKLWVAIRYFRIAVMPEMPQSRVIGWEKAEKPGEIGRPIIRPAGP